ncbi:hypothetical protein [Streptomyces sp. Ag109_G2-15]|uniref:hypothetical protein n=1 Tax=Streptomyces sp. Ag109_G2-15 TaxID=1938850 RepID=UPI0015CF778A|nr:hypothetical protein [Streptomyces sp. Ag109_G2-15]
MTVVVGGLLDEDLAQQAGEGSSSSRMAWISQGASRMPDALRARSITAGGTIGCR